jgi:thymidylate synthase
MPQVYITTTMTQYEDHGILNFATNIVYNHEEAQYISMMRHIIDNGSNREDRTNIGTRAIFGQRNVYSLVDGHIPLLTTKFVPLRLIFEELMWFISGKTDVNILKDKKVHIWDANTSREFLDARGLKDYKEGDAGPIYGHQWRHNGAPYEGCDKDYTGQGFDQLNDVIDKIKSDPHSRRIMICSWNPSDLTRVCLPACHTTVQFYVDNGALSCMMYQRSADVALGVPFNIVSYALLTHMIAHITHLKPGTFIHIMGDTHIYNNHIDIIESEQMQRIPYKFPTINISRKIDSIEDFTFEDITLYDYPQNLPRIHLPMAI